MAGRQEESLAHDLSNHGPCGALTTQGHRQMALHVRV